MTCSSRLRSFALPALVLGSALAATTARSGALNALHRFERVGAAASDPVALLPMPGFGRVLVAQRDGSLRLTTGDGLVLETLAKLTVSQTCAGEGLLGATWHPAAPGALLYVSYIQQTPRRLTIAQLDIDKGRVVGGPTILYQVVAVSNCTNLGGGIAVSLDGKILLGTGDMGNASGAAAITTTVGKILRVNVDGTLPTDNAIPGSAVYALGIRNPVRLTLDESNGNVYFLDIGPGMNDEVNLVARNVNYAWPTATGRIETGGYVDPVHVWATPAGPSGIVAYRGSNLGTDFAGDPIVVTRSTGEIVQLNTAAGVFPPAPGIVPAVALYAASAGEPTNLVDALVHPDGYLYVIDDAGDVWRLYNDRGATREPSDLLSIAPLLVTKGAGADLVLSVERRSSATQYGLYHGNLATLASAGYSHGATADRFLPATAPDGDAWERFTIAGSSIGGPEGLAYVLMSADSAALETTVGHASNNVPRPGGGFVHTCELGCDVSGYGVLLGQCAPDFTLNYAVQGIDGPPRDDFNEIGPVSFGTLTDCKVTLMAVSAEWCPPCHAAAEDGQRLWDEFKGRGDFMHVDIIPEDNAGNAATPQTVQNWSAAAWDPAGTGLTYPVLMDENYREFGRWWPGGNGACNGWPHIYLFDRNGKMTDFWCGFNAASIDAAVRRELAR